MILTSFMQKALLPIWALLLLFALLDSSMRLNTADINNLEHWQAKVPAVAAMQMLSQEQAEQITSGINKYEVEAQSAAIPAEKNTGMSDAEKAAQQGKLNQLYAGDLRFRLMGVFAQNGHFAVLLRKDLSGDTQQLLKVQAGELLENYKISKILANKVLLEADDGRQISLTLFKKITDRK